MAQPLSILLIDDHPASRAFLGSRLAALGTTLHLADSAVNGLAILRRRDIDLVLSKLSRPERENAAIASFGRHCGGATTLVNLHPQQESADAFDLTLASPCEIFYFFDALRYLSSREQDIENPCRTGLTS